MWLCMPKNEILINQLLETDNISGTKYYQFLKNAIQMRDETRFRLINLPVIFLQVNSNRRNIDDYGLYSLLSPTLYKINKLLIDNNDFELFKSEINSFVTHQVIKPPNEIQNQIEHNFYNVSNTLHINKLGIRLPEDIKSEIEYCKFLIKFRLSRDLEVYKSIDNKLDIIESKIIDFIDEFKSKNKLEAILPSKVNVEDNLVYEEIIKDIENSKKEVKKIISGDENLIRFSIKPELNEFKLNAIIYRTFFVIGAYLIFCKRNKEINGANYIKELWYHINPVRQNVGFIVANVPVSFEPFWLILLYLFGCQGSESWMDWPWHEFDDFHSADQYIIQYFLLCLTRSGDLKNIFPPLNHLKSIGPNRAYLLHEWYDIAKRFSFKQTELIDNINILIQESEDWDELLGYVKLEDNEEKKITAKMILTETRDILEQLFKTIKEIIPEIEKLLGLDNKKTQEAIAEISESYFRSSNIPDVIKLKKYEKKEDYEKEFLQIYFRTLINKYCLIKSDFVDCSSIWHDLGHYVALGEYNHLYNIIIENDNIEIIKATKQEVDDIYKKIVSTVEKLKDKYNPNLLLFPNEMLHKFGSQSFNKESLLYEKVLYDDNEFLIVKDKKIMIISSNYFENIVLLDNSSISWIYKPDSKTKKRIIVDISEYKEDLSKVDITAKTVVNAEIIIPEAIKIIEASIPKEK